MSKAILNKSVSFDGYYDAGEEIYASCMQFNALLKINKNDGQVEIVATFPNEPMTQQSMHWNIYCVERTLIFVPSYATGIYTYSLQRQQMEYYPIAMPGCVKVRCIDSHQVGDKIWLFYAYADNPIVVYDVNTHRMEYFNEMTNVLPEEIRVRPMPMFWSTFARKENELYGVIWKSSYIVHLNMDTMDVEIISLQGWTDKLTGVAYNADVLYFTELGSEEVKTLRLLDGSGELYQPQEDMMRDKTYEQVYSNVIACEGQILLIPNSGRKIYSLRYEDGMIVPFADLPEEYEDATDERKGWRRHYGHYFIKDGIRLCPYKANMMLDINVAERTIHGQIYRFGELAEEEYFKQIVCPHIKEQTRKGEVCESGTIDLEDFLRYVTLNK